jgi:hypothetical protein
MNEKISYMNAKIMAKEEIIETLVNDLQNPPNMEAIERIIMGERFHSSPITFNRHCNVFLSKIPIKCLDNVYFILCTKKKNVYFIPSYSKNPHFKNPQYLRR